VNAPTELASAIRHLLNNPAEAQQLANAGYEHMSNTFSLRVMLDAYRKHYRSLFR
jgi:glycosyltransferase involved in cell wall biosynthesis